MSVGKRRVSLTVVLAFIANILVALAKSGAALLTGSASLVAEAAHSWADTGNEALLVVANRRSAREPDESHPFGYGREAYVWSMFAAIGLFVAGATVSVVHGAQELIHPEPTTDFAIGYGVLAVAFVFEGISFLQSVRQARAEARDVHRDLLEQVLATSDPTLRAVFAEDSAALTGLVIAALALLCHQLTGSSVPDGAGSIAIGVLLAWVAFVLVNRNRRFIVGEAAAPAIRQATIDKLLCLPEIDRVTYLHMEIVGPRQIFVTGDVDLTGDRAEPDVAVCLRGVEAKLTESASIVASVLSLSAPDEDSIDR